MPTGCWVVDTNKFDVNQDGGRVVGRSIKIMWCCPIQCGQPILIAHGDTRTEVCAEDLI